MLNLNLSRQGIRKPVFPIINHAHPSAKGLVFDLPLWEAHGQRITDLINKSVGNFRSTSTTFANWIAHRMGPALNFDGTTQYIDFPHSRQLGMNGTGITLEAWVYRGTANGSGIIIAKPVADGSHNSPFFDYSLHWVGTNDVRIWVTTTGNTGGVSSGESGAALPANKLYHLVGTYRTNSLYMYVNGAQVDSDAASGTLRVDNTPLRIGANGTPGEFLNTPLFSARIWNRGMDSGEVRSLYQDPWQIYRPSMAQKAYYFFNSQAGIAFDAASNSGYQATASTYNWLHTCTGSNRYLVVGVSLLSVVGSSVTGITYNTIAMTFLGAISSVSGAVRAELWGLAAPATGSNSIEVTLSTGLVSAACAVSFVGVHQSSSTEGLNTASATNVGAADATVNVTTVADNDWVVDQIAANDTAITVGAGQTSRNNVTGAVGSGADSTEGPKSPAGSVTMSWTDVGATVTWSIAAIALRPVAASGVGGDTDWPKFQSSGFWNWQFA